jgi:hypothetical protein
MPVAFDFHDHGDRWSFIVPWKLHAQVIASADAGASRGRANLWFSGGDQAAAEVVIKPALQPVREPFFAFRRRPSSRRLAVVQELPRLRPVALQRRVGAAQGRNAHLYWLHSRGVQEWLVHLLFTGDPQGPTTRTEWEDATKLADERMGLTGLSVPRADHVCLEAGTFEELVG